MNSSSQIFSLFNFLDDSQTTSGLWQNIDGLFRRLLVVRAWEEAYLHSRWASLFSLTYPCKSLNKSLEEFQNVSLLGGVTACWTWLSHSKPWSNLFYSILSQRYLILKGKEKFEVNQYILWWPQGQWASCGMLALAWPDLQENERILPLYAERSLMLCI